MRGTKRYSVSTKKKAIDTMKDPYMSKLGKKSGMCTRCSSVYASKRWRFATEKDLSERKKFTSIVCPACKKTRDKYAGGYVTLKGAFVGRHREELLHIVKNKEARSMYTNPLERIIEVKGRGEKIEITTTTEKLAQRIGQIVEKAYSGKTEYKWSAGTKIARVVWTRER